MKPKTIVTAVLLLFVTASVIYLVVKETGGKPQCRRQDRVEGDDQELFVQDEDNDEHQSAKAGRQ